MGDNKLKSVLYSLIYPTIYRWGYTDRIDIFLAQRFVAHANSLAGLKLPMSRASVDGSPLMSCGGNHGVVQCAVDFSRCAIKRF